MLGGFGGVSCACLTLCLQRVLYFAKDPVVCAHVLLSHYHKADTAWDPRKTSHDVPILPAAPHPKHAAESLAAWKSSAEKLCCSFARKGVADLGMDWIQ